MTMSNNYYQCPQCKDAPLPEHKVDFVKTYNGSSVPPYAPPEWQALCIWCGTYMECVEIRDCECGKTVPAEDDCCMAS